MRGLSWEGGERDDNTAGEKVTRSRSGTRFWELRFARGANIDDHCRLSKISGTSEKLVFIGPTPVRLKARFQAVLSSPGLSGQLFIKKSHPISWPTFRARFAQINLVQLVGSLLEYCSSSVPWTSSYHTI